MILIIIFAIITIVFTIKDNLYYSHYSIIDYIGFILSAFLFGVIGAACGLVLSFIFPMELKKISTQTEIESLQDNNSINGNFFLGCGQINGEMKYVLYIKNNEFYEMKQLAYNNVQIKYSDNTPTLHTIEKVPTDSWINYIGADLDVYDITYIVEVPKGTIKNNYSLDAQ